MAGSFCFPVFVRFVCFDPNQNPCGPFGSNRLARPIFRKNPVFWIVCTVLCRCNGYRRVDSLSRLSKDSHQNQPTKDDLPFNRRHCGGCWRLPISAIWFRFVFTDSDPVLDYCQHCQFDGGWFSGDHCLFGGFLWRSLA